MIDAQAYLPPELAQLDPDGVTQGFWDACNEGRLAIQQCSRCKTFRHMPKPTCPNCYSFDYEYANVSGRGVIFSYTIAHHPVHPALRERGPYNIIAVDLDDAPGVRLVSNLVGVPNDQIEIGMPVEVVFEEQAPGVKIPRFRPRA